MQLGIQQAAMSQARSSSRVDASSLFLCGTRRGKTNAKRSRCRQGDVDGPLECSLAVGDVAAELRLHVAGPQAAGSVPTISKHCKYFQINIKAPCPCSKATSQVAEKSIQDQTTHGIPCKKNHLVLR